MPSIAELLGDSITPIKLKILVFGPQVKTTSDDARIRNLQKKRIEIRLDLEAEGHEVKYAEDLVDPSLVGPTANPIIQELVIMQEYDFIVTLVGSPGANSEATMISLKPLIARKSSLYIDRDHIDGLPGQACLLAEEHGGHLHQYNYPADLTECHLLGHVRARAEQIKLWKYLG